jgi:ABC-type arginine transport system ATPase subunit
LKETLKEIEKTKVTQKINHYELEVHMKFATIVVNISTCEGIEPLKPAFLAQVTYNNQVSIPSKKMQKEKPLQLESKKLFDL